jgi:hypothetical protein
MFFFPIGIFIHVRRSPNFYFIGCIFNMWRLLKHESFHTESSLDYTKLVRRMKCHFATNQTVHAFACN